jgi:hypothetical protein
MAYLLNNESLETSKYQVQNNLTNQPTFSNMSSSRVAWLQAKQKQYISKSYALSASLYS